ncbi:MAG: hypothetical protein CMJ88_03660 [Planctomycetes bacterium]|nr:hypothetical protein [Planctomycetota bacterium]
MTLQRIWRTITLGAAASAGLLAQEWTDAELVERSQGFQSPGLTAQIEQVGKLLAQEDRAFLPVVARLHGDYREYRLKIDRLLNELCDASWRVRENAERTLVEIGGRALGLIEKRRKDYEVLEQHIRCSRILDALAAKGTEQEDRERRLLQGLVRLAAYLEPDERLLRSLRSALGHTDAAIAGGAIRALGRHGGDDEARAVLPMITYKSGLYRPIALSALARMGSPVGLASCRALLFGDELSGALAGIELNRTEMMSMVRALRTRSGDDVEAILNELRSHPDPVIAAGASASATSEAPDATVTLTLPERTEVTGRITAMFGDSFVIEGAFAGLSSAELSFSDCSSFDFPDHKVLKSQQTMVFLNQGSRIAGELLSIDAEAVRLETALFGPLSLPRGEIQGIAIDAGLDRLVGSSNEHDRVRLRSGEIIDGDVAGLNGARLVIAASAEDVREIELSEVAGVLFTRPPVNEPDPTSYARLDLTTGERLIGFVAEISKSCVATSVPSLGAATVPWTSVSHVELGVGGGAMWGFTLVADYSDNRIVEIDDQGRTVFVLDEIFGAWDAECLDNDNLLITEFSVSRVQEVNRAGETVWQFEDLKNPYGADRLPNGNTLIADTFASRVIEIDREGNIVWSYATDIRPFDVDRLPNGNTLIADVLKDRVLEVSRDGEVVWEGKGLPNAHDADRLPNGNTLVTLRNKGAVLEIDRNGNVIFELSGLSSPSDADRLPNGNTIVAENTQVREFDRHGNEVWQKEMTWAVEVNRY